MRTARQVLTPASAERTYTALMGTVSPFWSLWVPVRPLPAAEVKLGAFQRGATVVRTSNGIEYRRLYIRRRDVRAAAAVLKKSGVRFASIEESLAASEASMGPAVGGETEAAVV